MSSVSFTTVYPALDEWWLILIACSVGNQPAVFIFQHHKTSLVKASQNGQLSIAFWNNDNLEGLIEKLSVILSFVIPSLIEWTIKGCHLLLGRLVTLKWLSFQLWAFVDWQNRNVVYSNALHWDFDEILSLASCLSKQLWIHKCVALDSTTIDTLVRFRMA